ncbi:MAG: hypothetical protein M3406_02005 [Chloroflexota bacterium]|nr:hypothetical protein [Chloroflexota bacterium]
MRASGGRGNSQGDDRIAALMAGVSEQIARRVSPNVCRASEFERLRREVNPAIEQILSSPMTALKGELAAA